MTTRNTAAEQFLFDADPRINQLRDHLATICAALSSSFDLEERHLKGIHRLAEDTLDEACAMEADWKTAWAASFSGRRTEPMNVGE